jgi:hypothetical protein
MAYINAEEIRVIRNNLKEAFPAKDGWKLSVRGENHSSIHVSVVNAPYQMIADGEHTTTFMHSHNIDHCDKYVDVDRAKKDLHKMFDIINVNNFDKSDAMSDYFHVGFYCHLSVGSWEKPFSVHPKFVVDSPIEEIVDEDTINAMSAIADSYTNHDTFIEYVMSFYNDKDGIYPIAGLTTDDVKKALEERLENSSVSFQGDSIDREAVRDIIIKNMEVEPDYTSTAKGSENIEILTSVGHNGQYVLINGSYKYREAVKDTWYYFDTINELIAFERGIKAITYLF